MQNYMYKPLLGEIRYKNKKIYLGRKENLIFSLLEKYELVTLNKICECLYNAKLDNYYQRSIYKYICELRHKIKPVANIKARSGFGYKLERRNLDE